LVADLRLYKNLINLHSDSNYVQDLMTSVYAQETCYQ